jgi:hypothetical protein
MATKSVKKVEAVSLRCTRRNPFPSIAIDEVN